MEQIAFKMRLRPGQADEYRRRHDAIWSELVRALRDAGVRDYSIFLDDETHVLFAVLRHTFDHGLQNLHKLEVVQRWWRHMADIMDTNADCSPWQRPLKPLFHLD